jgi:hypothetical protein
MKKHHELVARIVFDDWLKDQLPSAAIRWNDSEAPHPDWYLSINDDEYWVEATTIVPRVRHGRNLILEPSLSASIHDFVDEIEDQAKASGILHGGYVLSCGPMPRRSSYRDRIVAAATRYIRDTAQLDRCEPLVLDVSGEYSVQIQKLSNTRDYLAEMVDLSFVSEAETNQDFSAQLHEMIKRKAKKYAIHSAPTILLLLDGFHIVDGAIWQAASKEVDELEEFEAVFRIKPANPPLLLFSKFDSWPPP